MDYNRTLEIVLTALLGSGGIAAVVSAIRAKRARDAGLSHDEKVVTSQIPLATHTTLGTPDWEALTRYWQGELQLLRQEFSMHRAACAAEKAEDSEYIDQLEAHIWQGKPPPPPKRRTHRDKD